MFLILIVFKLTQNNIVLLLDSFPATSLSLSVSLCLCCQATRTSSPHPYYYHQQLSPTTVVELLVVGSKRRGGGVVVTTMFKLEIHVRFHLKTPQFLNYRLSHLIHTAQHRFKAIVQQTGMCVRIALP